MYKLFLVCALICTQYVQAAIDDTFLAISLNGLIELRNPFTGACRKNIKIVGGYWNEIPNPVGGPEGLLVKVSSQRAPTCLGYFGDEYTWNLIAGFNEYQFNLYSNYKNAIYSSPATSAWQSAYARVKESAYDYKIDSRKESPSYKVVCGTRGGRIGIFDVQTGMRERLFDADIYAPLSSGNTCFTMFQDGQDHLIASGSHKGACVDIHNYDTGNLIKTLQGFQGFDQVSGIAVFKDYQGIKIVATTIQTGQLSCWNVHSGEQIFLKKYADYMQRSRTKSVRVNGLILYKDVDESVKVVAIAKDCEIKIWNAQTGEFVQSLSDDRLNGADLLEIKPCMIGGVIKLVATYENGMIAVWNMSTGMLDCYVQPTDGKPSALVLFEHEESVYCSTCREDGIVCTWKLDSLELMSTFQVKPIFKNTDVVCLATRQGPVLNKQRFALSHSYVGSCGPDMPFFDFAHLELISV